MRILSKRCGFDCDHSSVSYEFISKKGVSEEAKKFALSCSKRFTTGRNSLKITIPGEGYLYDHIQEALLNEYNFPLLIYEDYDWWNFLLMFDYSTELMKNLKKYVTNEGDHTINVTQKSQKIELWITVHLDYGAFRGSPFNKLGKLFLEIREEIIKNNLESLDILKRYCNEENLSNLNPLSQNCRDLISMLDSI
ncbi:hypothetical protein HZC30_06020 [Candidatus Woesearchaeota archaeon]|nr:hypothetical protein [Candidatus Woesearchaeota archaeon]